MLFPDTEEEVRGLVEGVGYDDPAGAVGNALVIAVRCRRLGEPVHGSHVHAPSLVSRRSCPVLVRVLRQELSAVQVHR